MTTPGVASPKSVGSILKIIGAILLLMILTGGAIFFYANTIVEWWLPTAISLGGAIILWIPLKGVWGCIWTSGAAVVRFLVHVVFLTALLECSLLAVNFIGADTDHAREQPARVVRKYSEKHYHSQRVGRGHYVKGREYYTYQVVLQFPEGQLKTITLSPDVYARTSVCATFQFSVASGMLGWPIIIR